MENSEQGNSQTKLPKMKICQTVQQNLSTIGISPNSDFSAFNVKISIGLLLLGSCTVSMLIYIFYEAKTFFQYTQSIYVCSVFILTILTLIIMVLHSSKMLQIIDGWESLANTSKYNTSKKPNYVTIPNSQGILFSEFKYSASQSNFIETHQQVEKIGEIIFFVTVKLTPAAVVLPPLTYSFLIYFTTDSGPNAFILPLEAW